MPIFPLEKVSRFFSRGFNGATMACTNSHFRQSSGRLNGAPSTLKPAGLMGCTLGDIYHPRG